MRTLIVLLVVLAPAAAAAAPPEPGPEYAKLAPLVGNFATEGESIASPLGPAEKCAGTISSEWYEGHFAVLRHVAMKCSISGENRGLNVITYKPSAKAYTLYVIGDKGSSTFGNGTIFGDTLQMIWPVLMNGKEYKIRGTAKGLGTDKLVWREEYSEDGKSWKAFYHSIETRTK